MGYFGHTGEGTIPTCEVDLNGIVLVWATGRVTIPADVALDLWGRTPPLAS